jgi:hypothetical protein
MSGIHGTTFKADAMHSGIIEMLSIHIGLPEDVVHSLASMNIVVLLLCYITPRDLSGL